MSSAARKLEALREEALAAARGLSSGESALAGVLREMEDERSRAAHAYHAVIRSLAAALEARDGYTGEHSDDVHDLSVAVAERLGLEARAVGEVSAVALLHDIGKIGVPDHVLHKPGPLTPEEWELMRQHPVIGERILLPLPGLGDVARAVRHEHERWDGGGYPDGLAGPDIPLPSRIVLACDAYHALVSDRPYRRAMSAEYAIGELRGGSGTQFDPAVVDALLWCVSVEGGVLSRRDGAEEVARALSGPGDEGSDGGRGERELHALLAIASAVGAAHRLEDVVELAAEQACAAIGAASLAVSRWEVQRRVLRTLVNVGDLHPSEERRPVDEVYRLDGDDAIRRLIEDGEAYTFSLDSPDIPEREAELLRALGKAHVAGVAIMLGGRPWGELWAVRTGEQRPFCARDVRFLQTVGGQIAAAAGRAEVFSRMAELAFEDGLTGVANRRALDERLELALEDAASSSGRDVAVLLCDVDNLKELNDLSGHAAGDEALVRVASALRTAVLAQGRGESSLVARCGGDEFCVLLEGASAEIAQATGERVLALLRDDGGPALTVSCGVASLGLGAERGGDLLRAADAAQYTAKRTGRGRVCVADPDLEGHWRARRSERRSIRGRREAGGVEVGPVLAYTLEVLDGPLAAAPVLDRLEAVSAGLADAVDATGIAISWRAPGGALIESWFAHDRRSGRTTGRRFGTASEDFPAERYPASVELLERGGLLHVAVDDMDADAAERALLDEYGMSAMIAVGLPEPSVADGAWLVELYADARTRPLAPVGAALRLLGAEAVRGAPARVRQLRFRA